MNIAEFIRNVISGNSEGYKKYQNNANEDFNKTVVETAASISDLIKFGKYAGGLIAHSGAMISTHKLLTNNPEATTALTLPEVTWSDVISELASHALPQDISHYAILIVAIGYNIYSDPEKASDAVNNLIDGINKLVNAGSHFVSAISNEVKAITALVNDSMTKANLTDYNVSDDVPKLQGEVEHNDLSMIAIASQG